MFAAPLLSNPADVLVHPVALLPLTRGDAGTAVYHRHRHVVSADRSMFHGCRFHLKTERAWCLAYAERLTANEFQLCWVASAVRVNHPTC